MPIIEVLEQVDDGIDVDLGRVQDYLTKGWGFPALRREAFDVPAFHLCIEGSRSGQVSPDVLYDAAHKAVAVGVDA